MDTLKTIKLHPVLQEDKLTHYVSQSEMIRFIELNSDLEWNKICDLVREHKMLFEEHVLYPGKIPEEEEKYYSEFTLEWINKFYEAHPFLKRVMFVFDD